MSSSSNQEAQMVQEQPMFHQVPAAAHSQDVRHILARSFRSLYTREAVRPDTINNLRISKDNDDAYHEHYVNSLLKVTTEWQHRMDEIAMLERHIMQAQAKAMSADERELHKATISCDNYKDLGLPPVRAHFRSCIDTKLLRDHCLLTPSDYLVPDPVPTAAPAEPKIPAYAAETVASCMHSQKSMDQNEKTGQAVGTVVKFQSLSDEETEEDFKKQDKEKEKVQFPKKNSWKEFLSAEQREADRKYLDMLEAKANFLRNPRHILDPIASNETSLIKAPERKRKLKNNVPDSNIDSTLIVFVPEPPVVEFRNYKVGEVYEITLELRNVSAVMQQCHVLPPSSNIFSVGLGQFPGDSGLVAPGMSCTYGVRFTPHSLRNYDDYITVRTRAGLPLVIPLKAKRLPPVLTLPSSVNIGSCLVGGTQAIQLLVKNEGGQGRFCLMPRNKWPTASIRSVLPNVTKTTIKQPPFEIYPATFELGSGQSIALEVIFSPQAEKTFIQDMTIACDNCNVAHFKLKGEGEIATVNLVSVELGLAEPLPGEFIDISTNNLVRFEDLNPFTYTERTANISNCTNTTLHYQWMVYKPIVTSCITNGQQFNNAEEERVPDLQSGFSIFPTYGVLQPSETAVFRLTFAPSSEGSFHSVAHMLLQNIPQQRCAIAVSGTRKTTIYDLEGYTDDENSILETVGMPPFKDITALGLELKGKCVPLNVVLHPYALIIQSPVLRGSTVKRLFTMANHSFSTITFKWESYTESYIIEVEPPFGDLEPGMAMDFEMSVTGVEPGMISHTMLCHILNMPEPLHFLVQAEFMGPELKIEEPSINFGLIRVGQCEIRQMTITNTSETVVKYTITECPADHECDGQTVQSNMMISETSGELKPFARKTITLTLIPEFPQTIRRIILLEYEGGKSCSIEVYGEAQNPVVCFLECQKFLSNVYLSVPAVFTVVLHNQTLLPTTYKWGKAIGSQCSDCIVEVAEEEGEILSWQQKTVSVTFTPLKPLSFSDVILPCHVAGQDGDIYININCEVKFLAVSFKVSNDGKQFTNDTQLNFGDKISLGQRVTRYVILCNETAIPSSYLVKVEHFKASSVKPVLPIMDDTEKKVTSQEHITLKQKYSFGKSLFQKSAGQMIQDYNKQVLQKKRGLAFVVQPSFGDLQPFGREVIEISAHNDMWGKYYDNLIFKVGDLEEIKIPMEISVIGCPLSFQMMGAVPGEEAIVRFGSHVVGSDPISRKLRINNHSPVDIRVDWKVNRCENDSGKLLDFITYYGRAFPPRDTFGTEIATDDISESESFKILSPSDQLSSYISYDAPVKEMEEAKPVDSKITNISCSERQKVVFCCLRLHKGTTISAPFSIRPSQMVVPGRGNASVDFTFKPQSVSEVCEEMNFVGYVEGFLSLDKENRSSYKFVRAEAYHAEQLMLSFTAQLKPPMLTVENLEDDEIKFTAAVSDMLKDGQILKEFLHTQSIKLRNNSQAQMTFKIKVKEPFILVDSDHSSTPQAFTHATETECCTLKPGQYLMSTIAFRVSMALVPDISTKSAECVIDTHQKVNYEDHLTIIFLNGPEQKIPLHACLTIPSMELSDDYLDFGICLVGQTRKLYLNISNTTASHCCWKICLENKSETCSDETFTVQPDEGMLEAFVTHVSKSVVTVTVFFTASHSEAYDCTLTVYGLLGEPRRHVVVVGQGSYDGRYETIVGV